MQIIELIFYFSMILSMYVLKHQQFCVYEIVMWTQLSFTETTFVVFLITVLEKLHYFFDKKLDRLKSTQSCRLQQLNTEDDVPYEKHSSVGRSCIKSMRFVHVEKY